MVHINLIRVSPDSKYLDINIETGQSYVFSKLIITRFNGYLWEHPIDASAYLNNSAKEVLRIDLNTLGGTGMFKIEIGIKWVNPSCLEPKDPCMQCYPSDQLTTAYASDVSNVYKYLITKVISMNCNCYKLDEDLERNFMFLYAHQEAMQLNRITEAVKFYSALYKNFNTCGPVNRSGKACICQTKTTPLNIHYDNGCGCNK